MNRTSQFPRLNYEPYPSVVSSEGGYSYLNTRDDCSQRPVHLSDEELEQQVLCAAADLDWDSLWRNVSTWRKQSVEGDFIVYTRHDEGFNSVVAGGIIPCSLSEMMQLLWPQNAGTLPDAMSDVLGTSYRYGATVHRLTSHNRQLLQDDDFDITVKRLTFSNSNRFAKRGQWDYVDYYSSRADGKGFLVTIVSLRPEDMTINGRRSKYKLLHGIRATYSVMTEPSSRSVRVVFYGHAPDTTPRSSINGNSPSYASTKALKARVVEMAKAISRFPMVIRRNRLRSEHLGDRFIIKLTNPWCSVCGRAIKFLYNVNCRLCGYLVCTPCCLKQEVSTSAGRIRRESICRRCIQQVDDNGADTLRARCDTEFTSDMLPLHERPGERFGQNRRLFRNSYRGRDTSAASSNNNQSGQTNESRRAQRSSRTSHVRTSIVENESSLVQTTEDVEQSAVTSFHSFHYFNHDEDSSGESPNFPTSQDEAQRIDIIQKYHLAQLYDLAELDIICSLAAEELQCTLGILVIVDASIAHVIASTSKRVTGSAISRNEVFCSYTISSTKPFFVRHAQSDIRFSRNWFARQGYSFYCGFPVMLSDGLPVGTLACLDHCAHEVSPAQHLAMENLATTASKTILAHSVPL